jgi:hypothetical protein
MRNGTDNIEHERGSHEIELLFLLLEDATGMRHGIMSV